MLHAAASMNPLPRMFGYISLPQGRGYLILVTFAFATVQNISICAHTITVQAYCMRINAFSFTRYNGTKILDIKVPRSIFFNGNVYPAFLHRIVTDKLWKSSHTLWQSSLAGFEWGEHIMLKEQ